MEVGFRVQKKGGLYAKTDHSGKGRWSLFGRHYRLFTALISTAEVRDQKLPEDDKNYMKDVLFVHVSFSSIIESD